MMYCPHCKASTMNMAHDPRERGDDNYAVYCWMCGIQGPIAASAELATSSWLALFGQTPDMTIADAARNPVIDISTRWGEIGTFEIRATVYRPADEDDPTPIVALADVRSDEHPIALIWYVDGHVVAHIDRPSLRECRLYALLATAPADIRRLLRQVIDLHAELRELLRTARDVELLLQWFRSGARRSLTFDHAGWHVVDRVAGYQKARFLSPGATDALSQLRRLVEDMAEELKLYEV